MSICYGNPFTCVASFGIVGIPVCMIGLAVLPAPMWSLALVGIGAGLIFIPAAWLYYVSMAHEEVSRIVPILRLTSPQVLLFSVLFFGEVLTRRQGIAFFLLLVSGLLLSIRPGKKGVVVSRAALRLLPATALLAVSTVLMAYVYRTTSVWVGTIWYNLGMVIAVATITVIRLVRSEPIMFWSNGTQWRAWCALIVEQVVRLISGVATAVAMTHGVPVALTSVLDGTRLIWVWLLAFFLLKERTGPADLVFKFSAMAGVIMGVYLLK